MLAEPIEREGDREHQEDGDHVHAEGDSRIEQPQAGQHRELAPYRDPPLEGDLAPELGRVGRRLARGRTEVDEEELKSILVQVIRSLVGPIATPRDILIVDRLPKTRSGKILRGTMRAIADHKPYDTPATIEDPAVLDEIAAALN